MAVIDSSVGLYNGMRGWGGAICRAPLPQISGRISGRYELTPPVVSGLSAPFSGPARLERAAQQVGKGPSDPSRRATDISSIPRVAKLTTPGERTPPYAEILLLIVKRRPGCSKPRRVSANFRRKIDFGHT